MKRILSSLAIILVLGCSGPVTKSPTGRTQVVLFPDQYINSVAVDAFEEVKKTERLVTSGPRYEVLQRVGRDLAAVSGRNLAWEFILIDQDTNVNAWAMPGGKVAVYTGMYPVAETDAGLAAVVAHEIGHALARHSNERASHGALVDLLGSQVEKRVAGSTNFNAWMTVFGATTALGILLPYSRTQESEADEIGIMMMARAGYDPAEASKLWDRMAGISGSRPPQFLSTHPDPAARAAELRRLLPAAQAEYQKVPVKHLPVPLPR